MTKPAIVPDFSFTSVEDIEHYLKRTKPTEGEPASYKVVQMRTAALDELDKRNKIKAQQ